MLSDEEKKAIEGIKKDDEYYDILENIKQNKYNMLNVEKLMRDTTTCDYTEYEIAQSIVYFVNLIEKQQKEIEELKEINEEMGKALDEWNNGERTSIFHIHKDKIKAKIEELEIEQESNREDLKIAIDNLLFQNIDKIGNRISINMSVREILQSLLEKE